VLVLQWHLTDKFATVTSLSGVWVPMVKALSLVAALLLAASAPALAADPPKPGDKWTVALDPGLSPDARTAEAIGALVEDARSRLFRTGHFRIVVAAPGQGLAVAEANDAHALLRFEIARSPKRPAGLGVVTLPTAIYEQLLATTPAQQALTDLPVFKQMPDVSAASDIVANLLTDLAKRDMQSVPVRSSVLADHLAQRLARTSDAVSELWRDEDRPELRTLKFPAVVVELGNVAKKDDVERLSSPAWRQSIATALVEAVGDYFAIKLDSLAK